MINQPPPARPRLGSLVSVAPDGREAFIVAISHSALPIYQVQYLSPRGERKDHLTSTDLRVLNLHPLDDERLSTGLRAWLAERGELTDGR